MESDFPLLYQEFKNSADKFPQNLAVICNNGKQNIETVIYEQLIGQTIKVSKCLERIGLAMHSEQFVCLYMEQEICLPALIMGILRQKAAFVCLDKNATAEHRKKLFCLLNIRWIFTIKKQNISLLAKLSEIGGLKQEITVNGIVVELWELREVEIKLPNSCRSEIAYAIMTSGSCGDPKCVRVPHECITPNITDLRSILDVCPSDIIFLASPLTFDPCIVELFLALTSGAAVLIVSNAIKAAPSVLIEVLFPNVPCIYTGITIMQCTPSIISRWSVDTVKEVVLGGKSSLRALLLGGEPCPEINVLRAWRSKNNATTICNLYGITEVSCWASVHKIDFSGLNASGMVPLGAPLKETILEVRDKTGTTVVTSGLGELFIGSATRVCSIDNESNKHLQPLPLFRATGDIVKIDNNGMFYAYRKDCVVKRLGHRVNLVEVEQLAAQCDFVHSAHCVWDSNRKKLGLFIKFLKFDEDVMKRITRIKLKCREKLKYTSMPDLILHILEVPLTAHGKVSKRTLLSVMNNELDNNQKKLEQNCGSSSIQAVFHDLWLQHLSCSSILPNESFITQGGNSLVALALSNDLEKSGYALPTTFILSLLDGSTYEQCCKNLISLPSLRTDADKPILRKVQKHKAEDIVAKGGKRKKKFKRLVTEADVVAGSYSRVHFSLCRGRLYEYGTPVEANSIVTRVNDITSISLDIGWKVDLGKCVDASPLFIQYSCNKSIIVVGSHSHNLAIIEMQQDSALAGTVMSQIVSLENRIESSACTSPCGRFVFVGCYGGYIYCIETQSGKICWKFNTESCVKCSPALCLDGAAIAVGSYSGLLYCIRIQDGKLLWSTQPGSGGIVSSPCISQKNYVIFVGCLDGTCSSVSAKDGSNVWKTQLSSPIFSNPVLINGEKQVLFAEVTGSVHCISSKGDKVWTFQANGNIFSAISVVSNNVEDQILFGCHDKNVYCLQQVDGNSVRLKWKSELDSAVYATPFVFPFKVSTGESGNLVAAISTKGVIYLLDIANGARNCQLALPSDVYSSPIVHKDKLIVGCRDNYVYGVRFLNVNT